MKGKEEHKGAKRFLKKVHVSLLSSGDDGVLCSLRSLYQRVGHDRCQDASGWRYSQHDSHFG